MSTEIIVALVALAGAAVGGGLTMLSQEILDRRARYYRKRSIAHVIASEMEAYLDLMESRGHEDYARDIISMNRRGTRQLPKNWISGFERGSNPFPALTAMLPEIGILGSLSGDVAKFYSRVSAVRITLMAVDEGAYDEASPKDLAYIFEQELDLWLTAVREARTVISVLRAI